MDTPKLLDWWVKRGRFGLIGIGIGLIVLGGTWMVISLKSSFSSSDVEFYPVQESSNAINSLKVDIRGEVNQPGVYELNTDSRLGDLLLKAGGYTGQADLDWIDLNLNMARKLTDGEKVYIPNREEYSNVENSNIQSKNIKAEKIVNINTASIEELETLPGIGPSFAQRIIEYRNKVGGFKSKEEIQAVSGIGEKTFQNLEGLIGI